MKKIITLVLITIGLTMLAQEPTNPAAKAQYKIFNTNIEKLKTLDPVNQANIYQNYLNQAGNALKNIKKYEPAYNATALDETYNKYSNASTAPKQLTKDQIMNKSQSDDDANKFREAFYKTFNPTMSSYPNSDKTGKLSGEENVANYKTFLDEFLIPKNVEIAKNIEQVDIKKIYSEVISSGNYCPQDIDGIIKKRISNSKQAEINYYEIQSYSVKYNCLKKLFSNSPELILICNNIDKKIKEAGTKEQMMAVAEKNRKDDVNNKKMGPSVRTDASIEAEIKNALKDKEGTIIKINLKDKDWRIHRNELTGTPISRAQDFYLAMKKADGSCRLYDLILHEDFDGTKYLSGYVTGFGTGWEILCENVK